jgi:hypothetical protein
LRQTGITEAYITEFQRMAVMVIDILEQRLVMLFTEGLIEPLIGWVKAFRPTALQDDIMKTHDMVGTVPKKTQVKPFIPQKGQVTKPPQKPWTGKVRMDEETQRELRRKKLCYSCKEPWEPSHRCMGKGKVHYIEVISDEEDDSENEITHIQVSGQSNGKAEPPHLEIEEEKSLQGVKTVTIATFSRAPRYYTFRIKGILQGQRVTALIVKINAAARAILQEDGKDPSCDLGPLVHSWRSWSGTK